MSKKLDRDREALVHYAEELFKAMENRFSDGEQLTADDVEWLETLKKVSKMMRTEADKVAI